MSAVPAREREEAHRLLELVPDEDMPTVRRMLAGLARKDPVLAALEAASEDGEGELSEEAIAGIEQARRSIAQGHTLSTEELCRQLGL